MKRTSFLIFLTMVCGDAGAADPLPLGRAHAHNDYEHTRPLLDALDCGFGSIEADVHLVDGRLLVAHDAFAVKATAWAGSSFTDAFCCPVRCAVRCRSTAMRWSA